MKSSMVQANTYSARIRVKDAYEVYRRQLPRVNANHREPSHRVQDAQIDLGHEPAHGVQQAEVRSYRAGVLVQIAEHYHVTYAALALLNLRMRRAPNPLPVRAVCHKSSALGGE